jgi:BirA family biotin operon repressor/biotin-[acetyl-CoA-carboxylase] ligase
MAFDDYCAAAGYERALPVMQEWLRSESPNVRRAVSEGLRPWTASKRPYFARHPQAAIDMLGTLKDDKSRYVQESTGNALRDIGRKHFDLVLAALRAWIAEKPESKPRRTIARFALEKAVKEDGSLRQVFEWSQGPRGSTNDLSRLAGWRGEPEGLVIGAEEQVAGRGRLGRIWVAPPGCCVLCSVLLRPRFAPQQAFYLTVITALAIYRACAALLTSGAGESGPRAPVSIKWPNDVLVGGRKIAGILCESEFDGEGWQFAVVGFGINANLRPEELGDLRATATSLSAELGRAVDRALLLAHVLQELESLYLSLQGGQFGHVHSQWLAALETTGKRVSVREAEGTITGQALGVDRDGALLIRLDDGTQKRVLSGDVS